MKLKFQNVAQGGQRERWGQKVEVNAEGPSEVSKYIIIEST